VLSSWLTTSPDTPRVHFLQRSQDPEPIPAGSSLRFRRITMPSSSVDSNQDRRMARRRWHLARGRDRSSDRSEDHSTDRSAERRLNVSVTSGPMDVSSYAAV
jgi:hypothetical protein